MEVQQLSSEAAKRLNMLEKKLAAAAVQIAEEQKMYDDFFKEVWAVFDQESPNPGTPARFICEDGYVLGRIVPRPTTTMDTTKFIQLVKKHLPGLKGTRLLKRVIEYQPVVNQKLLAEEMIKGRIDHKIVQRCAVTKSASPRRERHPASKQDLQSLEAGILDSPTWEEESA